VTRLAVEVDRWDLKYFRQSSFNMYCGLRQKTKHARKKLRELRRCLNRAITPTGS
jgi:hypothetical protein